MTRPVVQRWAETFVRAPARVLIVGVQAYRMVLKPWLGNACRFEPTCSQYALTALGRHGAIAGAGLTTWRILRCHPWCDGGCDEVPRVLPGIFTRLGLGGGGLTSADDRSSTSDISRPDTAATPGLRASAHTVQEYER
jgi:putative membrane protein insertion efficiency factor